MPVVKAAWVAKHAEMVHVIKDCPVMKRMKNQPTELRMCGTCATMQEVELKAFFDEELEAACMEGKRA